MDSNPPLQPLPFKVLQLSLLINTHTPQKKKAKATIMLKTEIENYLGCGNGWGGVICEACERSPAVFICKADAASLCTACDAEIHSANPLARRHHRVLINTGSMVVAPSPQDESEAASWLLMNPLTNNNDSSSSKNALFLLDGREEEEEDEEDDDDEYLNFVEFNGCGDDHQYHHHDEDEDEDDQLDSVVPIEFEGRMKNSNNNNNDEVLMLQQISSYDEEGRVNIGNHHHTLFHSNSSKPPSYSSNPFLTHSHAISMEVGVVPESSTTAMSDISISNIRPPKGTIDLFSGTGTAAVQMPATPLSPTDREARVLRYREKKKTRKFEKTIRYASRKAYAETRPRIKGRFAKRTDAKVQLDREFSTPMMDAGYGIVPSF